MNFSCGPHCTDSSCGPGRPKTSINRCPCAHNQKPHKKKSMENFVFDPNTKVAAVYYNGEKPPHLFGMPTDVTLSRLKSELNQINLELNYKDTWRVDGVEYRRSSESVRFSQMKLMNDDDIRTMFSIFGQYGPIELDALLVRSIEHIQQSLIQRRNYEEIRELMDAPETLI
ncbi:hypothetical protein MTR_3g058650 [Medicago truncatula]|uniref:Uncharacterized protein n=1 Tax=Medicago truncatula TaxID=3880 RepID=A0A072UY63_MEDTR|nr:hypothetical protein MTR_3g058650 [Medicago truncatula]